MSPPTVRWSYSFESNGVRTKSPHRFDSEAGAICGMRLAAIQGRAKFRVVKWTTKPKPKVVAKLVTIQEANGSCVCCSDTWTANEERFNWIIARRGKRVRVTLEELGEP